MAKTKLKKRAKYKTRGSVELSDIQTKFCHEYLIDLNAKQAAIRAGYAETSAHVRANRLLKDDRVLALIGSLRKETLDESKLSIVDVQEQLLSCLTREGSDYVDDDGRPIPIKKLSKRARQAIDGIEIEQTILTNSNGEPYGETIKTKLKLVPKAAAIDMSMKHIGGYAKDNEQKGGDTNILMVPWDKLYQGANEPDVVEERLAAEKRIMDTTAKQKD